MTASVTHGRALRYAGGSARGLLHHVLGHCRFDPDMAWVPPPTGKRGRQPQYSDAAIQTCLTMKVLFGMALRQTTGFVESLLRLVGLDWTVPDFRTAQADDRRRLPSPSPTVAPRGG
jgi:hypothetical protein